MRLLLISLQALTLLSSLSAQVYTVKIPSGIENSKEIPSGDNPSSGNARTERCPCQMQIHQSNQRIYITYADGQKDTLFLWDPERIKTDSFSVTVLGQKELGTLRMRRGGEEFSLEYHMALSDKNDQPYLGRTISFSGGKMKKVRPGKDPNKTFTQLVHRSIFGKLTPGDISEKLGYLFNIDTTDHPEDLLGSKGLRQYESKDDFIQGTKESFDNFLRMGNYKVDNIQVLSGNTMFPGYYHVIAKLHDETTAFRVQWWFSSEENEKNKIYAITIVNTTL